MRILGIYCCLFGTVRIFLPFCHCRPAYINIHSFCLPWCFFPSERLRGNVLNVTRDIFRFFSPKILAVFSFYTCFEFSKCGMFSRVTELRFKSLVFQPCCAGRSWTDSKLWDSCMTLEGFEKPATFKSMEAFSLGISSVSSLTQRGAQGSGIMF